MPQALEDLEASCLYIARDSRRLARLFGQRVFAAVERLETFPESGRMVPELERPDVREVIVSSYRVIYRLLGDEVQVLTLHHGARRFPDLDVMEDEPADDRG
jgi:toxin ParE1/3/4